MDNQDAIVRSADLRPETKTLAPDLDRTPWPYQRATVVDAARGIELPHYHQGWRGVGPARVDERERLLRARASFSRVDHENAIHRAALRAAEIGIPSWLIEQPAKPTRWRRFKAWCWEWVD